MVSYIPISSALSANEVLEISQGEYLKVSFWMSLSALIGVDGFDGLVEHLESTILEEGTLYNASLRALDIDGDGIKIGLSAKVYAPDVE